MKAQNAIFIVLLLVVLSSCNNGEKDSKFIGEVNYYPAFLWVDENIQPVVKHFDFDFSQDAKNDSVCYAEFAFVDNERKEISTDVMQAYVEEKPIANNKFRVKSNELSKEVTFKFSPNAPSGKYQVTVKLVNHNLDRIGSFELTPGVQAEVFNLILYFNKSMNPLAKALMWICIVIVSAIAFWMVILKRVVYPRFRAINKCVIIPNQAPINIRFKGARMVVLDSQKHKQSWWSKMWTGKIIYKQNSTLTSPIILMPTNKGRKILFKATLTNYVCSPNPIGFQASNVKDVINKQIIVIQ